MLKWVSILFFLIPFAPIFGATDHSAPAKGHRPPAEEKHPAEEQAVPVDPEEMAQIEKALNDLSFALGRVNTGEQPSSN